MVMEYMKNGNLRDYLKNNADKLSWEDKIYKLYSVANGLKYIHDRGLVHRDFHAGNILNDSNVSYVTDLGLSRPANFQSREERKTYGVLPYVAPEVLRGEPYKQFSDIYSFGIIAYEIATGLPPYYNVPHDVVLSLAVLKGKRPSSPIKIPSLLEDLIKEC